MYLPCDNSYYLLNGGAYPKKDMARLEL